MRSDIKVQAGSQKEAIERQLKITAKIKTAVPGALERGSPVSIFSNKHAKSIVPPGRNHPFAREQP